jgi:hypothetical protein
MTFDLTQPAPKPTTLVECHELISRLWTYTRSIKEKLNCNSSNSSLSPSSERFKKSTTKADNKESWKKRTSVYWKKRKPGAQKGHMGVGRKLLPIEQVRLSSHSVENNLSVTFIPL